MAWTLRELLLLRLTASARTSEVAGERIGTAAYSGGRVRAELWLEETNVVLIGESGFLIFSMAVYFSNIRIGGYPILVK